MFLFSADSGARPVPLNSCSDVLLHLRKRGRHGHLELKCRINPTESFQIAQVLFCTVNFCSFRLAVLRLHGLRLCTQAVHSRLQAPRSGRGALRRGPERGLFQKIMTCVALDSLVSRIFLTPQRKGRKVEGGAKLNPQSRRGCNATPATLRGVQSYPCNDEGDARLPPQRRGGCKATPARFSRKWYRNGQFDAMLSSFENMHTFSLVVIL